MATPKVRPKAKGRAVFDYITIARYAEISAAYSKRRKLAPSGAQILDPGRIYDESPRRGEVLADIEAESTRHQNGTVPDNQAAPIPQPDLTGSIPAASARKAKHDPSPEYHDDALLTPALAAAYLSLAPKTLANWRSQGGGPEFTAVSTRSIRYRFRELKAFALARTRASTSDNRSGANNG